VEKKSNLVTEARVRSLLRVSSGRGGRGRGQVLRVERKKRVDDGIK